MANEWFNSHHHWVVWGITAGVFVISLTVLYILLRLVFSRLGKWAKLTSAMWDEQLIDQAEGPARIIVFLAAVAIALQFAPPEVKSANVMVYGQKVLLILAGLWLLDRTISVFFHHAPWAKGLSSPNRSLILTCTRVVVYSLALLTLLDTLEISITPLLASLGVGSIAVALALQDTLGNIFSGFYILLDKPVREGDFILVSGDVEGFVRQIGWRSTRIESTKLRTFIIPNSKLLSAILTNFDYPSSVVTFNVYFGVGYDSDLEHVEKVVVDVGKEVSGRVAGLPEFDPFVRFETFADSSINGFVVMKAKHYTDAKLIAHETLKKLHKRFAEEKITIPYPIRTVIQTSATQTSA